MDARRTDPRGGALPQVWRARGVGRDTLRTDTLRQRVRAVRFAARRTEPLIDNRDSKKRYRADVLIEDQIAKYDEKIEKEIAKARKRFGESFDEAQFRATNARVIEHQQKRDALHARYTEAMQGPDLAELKQIILDEEIVDPISGTKNWTDVRQFNLMFSTEMGSVADGSNKVYLRPETDRKSTRLNSSH